MMVRTVSVFALVALVSLGLRAADGPKAPGEDWDWATPMKEVAKKFKGTQGVYLHIGDSITYANQNTRWAKYGQGHNDATKAFLNWTHNGKKNDTDGWWLAYVDAARGRSHTAVSGIRADQYLQGGKAGLPPLADIIKKYNPQIALYMLGTNDSSAGRPLDQYIKDVEKALDMLLANGTIPILSTLPPRGDGKNDLVLKYNDALRGVAKAKKIPMIDLYKEMQLRSGVDLPKGYLSKDNIHLNDANAGGPPTEENLKTGGYLLRCYLAVYKGMEVKAKVIDGK